MAAALSADAEAALHHEVVAAVGAVARRYLSLGGRDLGTLVNQDRPVAAQLEADLEAGSVSATGSVASAVDTLVAFGVDRELAVSFGRLARLAQVADIAAAAKETGHPVRQVAGQFDALDQALGLSSFEARLMAIHPAGRWERWEVRRLLDDVTRLRYEAVVRGFDGRPASPRQSRFDRLARQVDGASGQALAVAALAVRALTELAESAEA